MWESPEPATTPSEANLFEFKNIFMLNDYTELENFHYKFILGKIRARFSFTSIFISFFFFFGNQIKLFGCEQ